MPKPNLTPPNLTLQQVARFWSYIDTSPGQGPEGTCHKWTKGRMKKGYGEFSTTARTYAAHRLVFFLAHGRWPTPNGCHSCDNPPCCNLDHIWEGDQSANMADCKRKGRTCTGDRHGAKLHPERVPRGSARWNFKTTSAMIERVHFLRSKNWTYQAIADDQEIAVSHAYNIANRKVHARSPM